MDIDISLNNPPEKVHTERGGSKYDKAIQTAIDNPNEWVEVASTTVENRSSMYSTASAIRGGRLGTIPQGINLQVICRRVDERVVMFMKSL